MRSAALLGGPEISDHYIDFIDFLKPGINLPSSVMGAMEKKKSSVKERAEERQGISGVVCGSSEWFVVGPVLLFDRRPRAD